MQYINQIIKKMLEIVFGIIVVVMLLLDLGVFNKKAHEITTKEAALAYNLNRGTLSDYLTGKRKNKTILIKI